MRGQLETTFVSSRKITLGSIDRKLVMVQSMLGMAGKKNLIVTEGNGSIHQGHTSLLAEPSRLNKIKFVQKCFILY